MCSFSPPSLFCTWLLATPLFVSVVDLEEHFTAVKVCLQLGANEERASHLAVQRVRLLGRRSEPVTQHHRDQAVDATRRALSAEVEGVWRCKCFSQDHHRLHVSILERLWERHEREVKAWTFTTKIQTLEWKHSFTNKKKKWRNHLDLQAKPERLSIFSYFWTWQALFYRIRYRLCSFCHTRDSRYNVKVRERPRNHSLLVCSIKGARSARYRTCLL